MNTYGGLEIKPPKGGIQMAVVINLFGGPGAGKSTTMARLFADLKSKGINCEMVSEFAKDLVYENRMDTMKDELYIFAKQNHRLFRVKDKVDVIITDRPLLLTCVYDSLYGGNDQALHDLVRKTFKAYNNVNIFLDNRNIPYKENEGRLQSEEEANSIGYFIREELESSGESFIEVETNNYDYIYKYVSLVLKLT